MRIIYLTVREPTERMLDEAVYNTNRKYDHNPVDNGIVDEVYRYALRNRPINDIISDTDLLKQVMEVIEENKDKSIEEQAKAIIINLAR